MGVFRLGCETQSFRAEPVDLLSGVITCGRRRLAPRGLRKSLNNLTYCQHIHQTVSGNPVSIQTRKSRVWLWIGFYERDRCLSVWRRHAWSELVPGVSSLHQSKLIVIIGQEPENINRPLTFKRSLVERAHVQGVRECCHA